jgi:methylmalonyl-CoA mutase N-terminal domain/subunit
MLKAIETGWVQREIADSAYRYQLSLERGERVVVGVNAFVEGESVVPVSPLAHGLESRRRTEVREFRAHRDATQTRKTLQRVTDVAEDGGNLVPPILGALKGGATVGEISDALREVFGVYKAREGV